MPGKAQRYHSDQFWFIDEVCTCEEIVFVQCAAAHLKTMSKAASTEKLTSSAL